MNMYKFDPHLQFRLDDKKIWISAYINFNGTNCFEYYDENHNSDFLYEAILPNDIKQYLRKEYCELFI